MSDENRISLPVFGPLFGMTLPQWDAYTKGFQSKYFSPREPWHYALGLCGEAGEVADLIKKADRLGVRKFSDMPVELQRKLRTELSDTQVYLTVLTTSLGLDSEECLIACYNEKIIPRLRDGNYYTHQLKVKETK